MKNLREAGSKNLIVKCYHANYRTFFVHASFLFCYDYAYMDLRK